MICFEVLQTFALLQKEKEHIFIAVRRDVTDQLSITAIVGKFNGVE